MGKGGKWRKGREKGGNSGGSGPGDEEGETGVSLPPSQIKREFGRIQSTLDKAVGALQLVLHLMFQMAEKMEKLDVPGRTT